MGVKKIGTVMSHYYSSPEKSMIYTYIYIFKQPLSGLALEAKRTQLKAISSTWRSRADFLNQVCKSCDKTW
jgi:hypothetical protein